MKTILLLPLDIWFYVSSVCFQGRLYTFRGRPSIISGTFGICYMFAPIILGWIRSDQTILVFFDDNPFWYISVVFLLFALLFLSMYYFYRSKKRGLRIIAKYHKLISHFWQIMTIWLFYMIVLIPFIWYLSIKLIFYASA